MRIFKNKAFHRWAKDVGLSDNKLKEAVNEISNGLYEANLGGHVFKKRVALDGRGKSSGLRTIKSINMCFSSMVMQKTFVLLFLNKKKSLLKN